MFFFSLFQMIRLLITLQLNRFSCANRLCMLCCRKPAHSKPSSGPHSFELKGEGSTVTPRNETRTTLFLPLLCYSFVCLPPSSPPPPLPRVPHSLTHWLFLGRLQTRSDWLENGGASSYRTPSFVFLSFFPLSHSREAMLAASLSASSSLIFHIFIIETAVMKCRALFFPRVG